MARTRLVAVAYAKLASLKHCYATAANVLRYDENFAIILETSFLIQFYRLYSLYNNSR